MIDKMPQECNKESVMEKVNLKYTVPHPVKKYSFFHDSRLGHFYFGGVSCITQKKGRKRIEKD